MGQRAVEGYLDATLLIQCSVRRRLAAMELAERRRLRDIQVREQPGSGSRSRSGVYVRYAVVCCHTRLAHTWRRQWEVSDPHVCTVPLTA